MLSWACATFAVPPSHAMCSIACPFALCEQVMEIAVTDQDFILRGLYSVLGAVLADHPSLKAFAGLPTGGNLLNEVGSALAAQLSSMPSGPLRAGQPLCSCLIHALVQPAPHVNLHHFVRPPCAPPPTSQKYRRTPVV